MSAESVLDNKFYKKAKEKATETIQSNERLKNLLSTVNEKMSSLNMNSDGISKLGDRLKVLVRMLMAYVTGKYRVPPAKTIAIVAGGLIYFVMPLDFIPDFIPITGLLDDFTVILWVYNTLQSEIDEFIDWESKGSLAKK